MTLLAPTPGPLWWRVPTWTVLTAITVVAADGTANRIAAGVLMTAAWVVLQFVRVDTVAAPAVIASTACGLAACYFSRGGLAPIVVCVAAARAPHALSGTALRGYAVAATVGFGVTVAVLADSLLGLFAGTAIPALLQRTLDHQALVRERDRAQALLVEAQRGREAEAQAAALTERGRIAREMHDVLAHSLAGLSVQLQAVRAVAAREQAGPAVLEPLDRAAALARDGLAEARAAVSTLRDPVGLGLAELPALVQRHPGAATLREDGPARTVTPDAGHAVYRAVQEALTNSARHAPGAAVTVELCWRPDSLEVRVRDTGRQAGRDAVAGTGTGLGLAGMAERLAQVGGAVEAGPDSGGWLVRVTVPAT